MTVLLYDGECGFCNHSVQLILRLERRHTLQFASLQGSFGTAHRAEHPELAGIDSIVWLEGNRALVRSEAALRVAAYLGGVFRLAALAYVLPRSWRDGLYDLIARNRHRLTPSNDFVCQRPTPEIRSRFMD